MRVLTLLYILRKILKDGDSMHKQIRKRIPETIALAICLGLLIAAWAPVYGQAYLVKSGDSLWKISKYFGVSVNDIQKANSLRGDLILAGQTLEIPESSMRHVVQKGESLYLLAKRYGTTIDKIMRANNLQGSLILIGQVLNIPISGTNVAKGRSVTNQEMELMARAVYSEARGESFLGQVAVAAVILNRVDHPDFPNTIAGVIYEPWAFTSINDGQFWLTPNQTAYAAVREALAGSDPTNGAIFYYNPVTATNQWIRSRPIVARIGAHVFAL